MRVTPTTAMYAEVVCSRRLATKPPGRRASGKQGNEFTCSARFGTCECNGRAGALSGPETASSGSSGSVRWPRATVGSAGALDTCSVASNGRRDAHIAPFGHRKKNVCNGRLDGRLGGRDYDICGLKSSSIPPVRSLEAWGAHPSELRTPRNPSISAYSLECGSYSLHS